jgi:hypothetical protein
LPTWAGRRFLAHPPNSAKSLRRFTNVQPSIGRLNCHATIIGEVARNYSIFRRVPTNMAHCAQYQRDGLAGALAIHLCLYCAVGGSIGFGLYELLQPARSSNPGIAAYKPPPRTVIAYGPSTGLPPPREVSIPEPIATDDLASQLETNGRSVPAPELTRIETVERPQPQPQVKKVKHNPKALARPEPSTQPENRSARVACIPRYDSSGAQTGAC